MTSWDPRSYVAEAVGTRLSSGAAKGSPCYYSYTMNFLRNREECEKAEKEIEEQLSSLRVSTGFFLGQEVTMFYSSGDDSVPWLDDLPNVLSHAEDEVQSGGTVFKDFCREVRDRLLVVNGADLQEIASVEKIAGYSFLQEAFLISFVEKELSVSDVVKICAIQSVSATALLKGNEFKCPVSTISSDGKSKLCNKVVVLENHCRYALRGAYATSNEGVYRECFTFFSDNLFHVCVFALLTTIESTGVVAAKAIEAIQNESGLTNFCFHGSDGAAMSYDEEEDHALCTHEHGHGHDHGHGSTRLWDPRVHRLRVVKESGNADALHLLGATKSDPIQKSAAAFMTAITTNNLLVSVSTNAGKVLCERIHSFLPFGADSKSIAIAVSQYSAMHNHLFECGATAFLFSISEASCNILVEHQLCINPEDCESVEWKNHIFYTPQCLTVEGSVSFTTEESFPIGDAIVIIGSIEKITAPCLYGLLSESKCSSCSIRYLPFICTTTHNIYGPIGFMGFGCAPSSGFPPTLMTIFQSDILDCITSDTDVVPNFTLYFFSETCTYLKNKTYPTFTMQLPFPLHTLSSIPESNYAFVIKCRLVRIVPLLSDSKAILVFTLSNVKSIGSDLLHLH